MNKSKILFFFCLILTFSGLGYADYSAFSDLKEQVAELQRKMDEITRENALQTEGAITASGFPKLNHPKHFYLFIDPMIMHAKVDGTSYAFTATGPANTLPLRADTKDVKFHWDWAIRCGAGYHFEKKDWVLEANYTWIKNEGYTKGSSDMLGSVMPLKGVIQLGSGVEWASSRVSLEQDSILGRVKKDYFVSPSVSLTPYGGLKSSWINLKQWTQYFGGDVLSSNVIHIRDKSRFWGLGPAIGSAGTFYMGRGFSLVGDLQLAFQYGLFRVEYDEMQSNILGNRIKLTESRHQLIPNFEVNLGAQWGTYLNKKRHYLNIGAAYQMQYWFRVNQIIDVLQANAQRYFNLSEDVTYLGLVIHAQITF